MELTLNFEKGIDEEGKEVIESKTFVTTRLKAILVRRSIEIVKSIEDINDLTPEALDHLIDFVCEIYKSKFTRTDIYEGLLAEELIPTVMSNIQGLTTGVQSKLKKFPTK